MKFLGLLLLAASFTASAAEPLPALYSFNDVYRLTVGSAPTGFNAGLPLQQVREEASIRVAAVETVITEPRFTVRQFPAPAQWLLALAGLALAGWVAHRRLSYL